MCCQGRLQHDGNACVKSDAAAQGCWTGGGGGGGGWGGRARGSKWERDKRERHREKINRASHRLTFGLVYLTMISSLSCSVRPVIPCWHQHAVLCCFIPSVSVSYIALLLPPVVSVSVYPDILTPKAAEICAFAAVWTDVFTLLTIQLKNYFWNSLLVYK